MGTKDVINDGAATFGLRRVGEEKERRDDLIHAIILTFNEEKHIGRCIDSIKAQVDSITVIDSGSSDSTTAIATKLGAKVITNPWINHSTQINFGIATLASVGGWLLRIDADEVLEPPAPETLGERLAELGPAISGVAVLRTMYFLGRRMIHGGIEPSWQLRVWRNGRGQCEARWMDEHIVVDGAVTKLNVTISDKNLNSISWWTDKHNTYSSLEAVEVLVRMYGGRRSDDFEGQGASLQAKRRRYAKNNIYYRFPPGVRAMMYFLYRYIARLGFLDGREGVIFHVLQGFWYRFLVDAKLYDINKVIVKDEMRWSEIIFTKTGIRVEESPKLG